MRNLIALEQFTNFSAEFLRSKLNKYKVLASKGIYFALYYLKDLFLAVETESSKSLLSRIIQLQKFKPPSLSIMSPIEWQSFLGKKLV